MPSTNTVAGEIVFAEELSSFSEATVNVYLEDVSRLDAPSEVVAKQVIPKVSHTRGAEERLEFALAGEDLDERASYSVRVHVDLHGSGQVQRGDFVTTAAYPVATRGNPTRVTVRVKEVT